MAVLYKQGSSVHDLAELFHCHRQTVARRLKQHGVILRANLTDAVFCDKVRQVYAELGT